MINFFLNKVKKIYQIKKYNIEFYKTKQNQIYKKNNLSKVLGIKKLINILKYLSISPKRIPEHQIILSAISVIKPNFKNILEIGTYDGQNSLILSNLFKHAKIYTIDLKIDNYYPSHFFKGYVKNEKLFQDARNNNIKKNKNIIFKNLNSIKLLNFKNIFYDLVWIDGNHINPYVTIDIINSLRLTKKSSIILLDDVVNKNFKSNDFVNHDSLTTLNKLQEERLLKFDLFFKNFESHKNYSEDVRKYIALVKKN
jgi:predicted O-methyltransferase YrrM